MRAPVLRAAPGRGFTLVELLVVMGVIAILMTLLVPTLHAIRRQNAVTRAKALIMGVGNALGTYRQWYRTYPPDQGIGTHAELNKSAECLVYYLSGNTIAYSTASPPPNYPWLHTLFADSTAGGNGRKSWKSFYQFKENMLADYDEDKVPELIDPWRKRYVYNVGTHTDGDFNQNGAPAHNKDMFDLFSPGADSKYGNKDDVRNWDDSLADEYNNLENP